MLDAITPIVLTWNEEPNIGRCLDRLRWARRVLVVDSGSTDRTIEISSSFPNVVVVTNAFGGFAAQWNFAIARPGIETEWILALDADFILDDGFEDELRGLRPDADTRGFRARFIYAALGRRLRASLYPPLVVLFRRSAVRIVQKGHNQVAGVEGERPLRSRIVHDDRKSLARWLESQCRYMEEETDKLLAADAANLSFADRVRLTHILAPLLVPFHLLLVKGLILDGRAGLYYTMQRTTAELILSMCLLERRIRNDRGES